jgi:acetyl-CoA C-acetyltransferase
VISSGVSGAVTHAPGVRAATSDNRWIAHPYTKRMCALPGVDQAAAVVVASVAAARRLGVPEERWVWPWADAGAHDTVEILERPSFATSEPMAAVLHDAMRAAGLEIGDVDLWELYSCFPVVPKLAIDALGLDDDAPVTVAGGLPFYGGPFNAYMLCAAVNMVRRLRAGDGVTGLLYGNGEFVTKHHALVVGRGPGPAGRLTDATTDSDDGSRQARLDRRPAPAVTTRPDGPARIETATVVYDRDGTPARGIVVGRTATGARFVANTPVAADQFAALVDPDVEPVGRSGSVQSNGDTAVFSLD